MDDGAARPAQRVGELDRVVQHARLGHDLLHGVVELAPRRREFVLVLDQNERRFGGFQREGGGRRRRCHSQMARLVLFDTRSRESIKT